MAGVTVRSWQGLPASGYVHAADSHCSQDIGRATPRAVDEGTSPCALTGDQCGASRQARAVLGGYPGQSDDRQLDQPEASGAQGKARRGQEGPGTAQADGRGVGGVGPYGWHAAPHLRRAPDNCPHRS